jgi:hypothetical protein
MTVLAPDFAAARLLGNAMLGKHNECRQCAAVAQAQFVSVKYT